MAKRTIKINQTQHKAATVIHSAGGAEPQNTMCVRCARRVMYSIYRLAATPIRITNFLSLNYCRVLAIDEPHHTAYKCLWAPVYTHRTRTHFANIDR